MKIEVLGSGCLRCETLYQNVLKAVAGIGSPGGIDVIKISDVHYFAQKGVLMTPGLIVDGEVISTGQLLSSEEIKTKIKERM